MKPDDFRRLVAAGLSTEQIAIVMEMMERAAAEFAAAEEARKSKARERVQRWRRNRNVTETQQKVTETLARVEDKTSNSEIEPRKKEHTHASDLAAFRSALSGGGCDDHRIEEFVKLRRKKRGTLTGHAADLFVADARACGLSVPAAVDTCISRNWITVKPDWLSLPQARAGPSVVPIKDTAANAARRRLEAIRNERLSGSGSGTGAAVDDHQPAAGLLPFLGGRAG